MFKSEVDYRLAKWMLINLYHQESITEEELRRAWKAVAEIYQSPFLEVEHMEEEFGSVVMVSE